MQYNNGYRNEIMNMLMSYGLIPYRSLRFLPGIQQSYTRALKRLEAEGIVRIEYVGEKSDKKKIAVLNRFDDNSQAYLKNFDRGYYGYVKNISSRIKRSAGYGSDPYRQLRAVRGAEVCIAMQSAGIHTLFRDKPKWIMGEKIEREDAYFYNSTELSYMALDLTADSSLAEEDAVKSTSRSCGVLKSAGGEYIVYHTGSKRLKWNNATEIRHRIGVRKSMVYKSSPSVKNGQYDRAIFFVNTEKTVLKIMDSDDECGFLNLSCIYNQMYMLFTNTVDSIQMLHNMTIAEWERILVEKYLPSHKTDLLSIKQCVIDCDGFNDQEYLLLFCIPDIKKLARFIMSAKAHNGRNKRFRIVCYSHQKSFVTAASEGFCEVTEVVLKAIEDL